MSKYLDLIKNHTPEEIADMEFRVIRDVTRLSRLPLLKAMSGCIEDDNMEGVEILWPSIVEVIALWKRNEVTMKVMLKRAIRARVRADYSIEALDRDYAALARENETLRIELRKLKGNK